MFVSLSNTANGQDVNEQYEIEIRKDNLIIRGMPEEESKNALSLVKNLTKFFEDHFVVNAKELSS